LHGESEKAKKRESRGIVKRTPAPENPKTAIGSNSIWIKLNLDQIQLATPRRIPNLRPPFSTPFPCATNT
jgi:hypothetical protein